MTDKKYKVDNPTAAIGELAKELYKKYGEEVFPVLRPVLRDYGFNMGVRLRQKLADLSFSNRVIAWMEPGIKAGVAEILEKGDASVKIKGSFCPLNLRGSGRTVCENLMAIDEGLISALADDREIHLLIEKTLAQGDPYCMVTFSIKE
jgi:hypothetical protein